MRKNMYILAGLLIVLCLSACQSAAKEETQPQPVVQEDSQPQDMSEEPIELEQPTEAAPEELTESEEPSEPETAQSLDLSSYDLQYGMHSEFLRIYDQIQPVEKAEPFEGTWHRTDTVSGLGAELTVTEQTTEGFSFVGDFWYYSHSGWMEGNAFFAAPNVAVYEYINDWSGEAAVSEYLVFEKTQEGMKVYATAASADLGFGMNVFADGNYTQGEPVYENATVFEDNFSEDLQAQMQALLGETNYEEYFKFPTQMGILASTPATLADGSGAVYYEVFVPTMGGYAYQLLVCENGDVYFMSEAIEVGFKTTVEGITEFPVYETAEGE